jgi:hypothetical protein
MIVVDNDDIVTVVVVVVIGDVFAVVVIVVVIVISLSLPPLLPSPSPPGQIPIVLTVNVVLQLVCIVMTNHNVKFPLLQYLDWFMTLMQVEMPVWFSFVIDHISIR